MNYFILKRVIIFDRTVNVRKRIIILYIDFFVASMVFYGLNMNAVNFGVDDFLYLALGGLMEIPSYTLVAPIIHKLGRRLSLVLFYLISGVSLFSSAFIPAGELFLCG